MTTIADVKQWIEAGLPGAEVRVMGDGRHFEAHIVCEDFSTLSTLKRHRLVYEALGDHMKQDIHALSLKTLTVDES